MSVCNQTEGMSILQHGLMVKNFYVELIKHLRTSAPLSNQWKLPDWIYDPRLIDDLLGDEIMAEYHVYHDCGKPYCRTVDDQGRQHFPDHAAVSGRVWQSIGGNPLVGQLIQRDMEIHQIKDCDVDSFIANGYSRELLLTGLAEIHANASMFGGIDSISFKIKYKQIDKRGAAIVKKLLNQHPK